MITKIENIPVTQSSYPFASAERYCKLSEIRYEETEYAMHGTANVYRTKNFIGEVEVMIPDAPYINRFVMRAPKDPAMSSGNVVVEIINPTSFMEIDRMWILGYREFLRNGDVYIGITSKPNTIAKMVEFNKDRYGCLSWKNPTPEKPFPFTESDIRNNSGRTILPDLDTSYETGLFWDMLTELAWLLRSDDEMNPAKKYSNRRLYLTGWSQSADYLFRYLNSFAYRPEVKRDVCVFDGYLAGGGVKSFVVPVNQYEALDVQNIKLNRVEYATEPFIAVQTESENGQFDGWRLRQEDSDAPEFKYRCYEVTGASHDTLFSYVDYYQKDPDLIRINHLPAYVGKHEEANDYPSRILFAGAFHNLFVWVRTGLTPGHCEPIRTNYKGENCKDAFGNSIGGLRTCLLNYPTGRYNSTSNIEVGASFLDPTTEKDILFGYQEAFSPATLKDLYGSLDNYTQLIINDTKEQVTKRFIVDKDGEELVRLAVNLAKQRGLI